MSETGKVYQIQYPTTVSGKVYNVRDVSGEQNVTGKVYQVASVNGGGGEPVEKTKFGASVDNFLGDVDENGSYVAPNKPFEVNLVGVKRVSSGAFSGKFSSSTITKFIANDLIEAGLSSFTGCCSSSLSIVHAEVDNIEIVSGEYAFQRAFQYCNKLQTVTFKKLKTISGPYSFQNAFQGTLIKSLDNVFPSLEYIYGSNVLGGIINFAANDIITFSHVKKITGGTTAFSTTFGGFYIENTVWNFPSATEMTGYIWNVSTSYPGEIHFAAANQAAIEACDGYANKWGFAGATIYFDL